MERIREGFFWLFFVLIPVAIVLYITSAPLREFESNLLFGDDLLENETFTPETQGMLIEELSDEDNKYIIKKVDNQSNCAIVSCAAFSETQNYYALILKRAIGKNHTVISLYDSNDNYLKSYSFTAGFEGCELKNNFLNIVTSKYRRLISIDIENDTYTVWKINSWLEIEAPENYQKANSESFFKINESADYRQTLTSLIRIDSEGNSTNIYDSQTNLILQALFYLLIVVLAVIACFRLNQLYEAIEECDNKIIPGIRFIVCLALFISLILLLNGGTF